MQINDFKEIQLKLKKYSLLYVQQDVSRMQTRKEEDIKKDFNISFDKT